MTRVALGVTQALEQDFWPELLIDSELVQIDDCIPQGTDLCIVDEAVFERLEGSLREWCQRQRPVFAPVLLLVDSETENPWAEYSGSLETIDAIQRMPASKSAIAGNIENLLETREYSRDLAFEHQLTDRIFETSPLSKIIFDTDGIIVRANDHMTEVLGVSKSDIVGTRYDQFDWTAVDDNGDPLPLEALPLSQVIETGEPVFGYEHGVALPDGDTMWLSINLAPLFEESGNAEYVIGVLEDITERRAQQRELERQVDLFEKAQNIANVGAWEYDTIAEEGWWTEEVRRIHGLETEVTPSPELSLDYFHPEDRDAIASAFERAVNKGEPYDLELRLIDDNENERWVRTRGEPQYEDGEIVRIRGTMQDITDRKERELALQQMTRAVDEAPIGVVITDPSLEDNPIIYVNDWFVETTGYSRDAAIGRNCRFLQGENTDEETVDKVRRAIDDAEPVSVVLRNYRADGSEFWNQLDISPVTNDDGEVINYIGFQQDVTDRIEQRRQLNIIDRYLRHNIRNEMGVIHGLAELIEDEAESPVTDYAREIVDHSLSLVDTIEKEREITNLLKTEPDAGPVELMWMLESVVSRLRADYPHAEIALSGPERAMVEAVSELEMALEELIENALVHNTRDDPIVEVTVLTNSDGVVVEIRDNGPGIPEMETDTLTGRIEETAVTHGGGLGLWLVYLVVRRCDGRIEFAENDPRGSTVTVSLPKASVE